MTTQATTFTPHLGADPGDWIALLKPRVISLVVFTGAIGLVIAPVHMNPVLAITAILCIAVGAGASGAINMWYDRDIDALMRRTAWRPSARGEITSAQIIIFSCVLGATGMWVLYTFTNALTMWLTLATFVGYAIIYTIILKPSTPQNIVIGGASGAMPPALGWAAVTGHVPAQAWVLVLIIFVWTPPHFWSLALYRRKEYLKSGLPMLPNTHGEEFTRLQILLYTIVLFGVSLLPYAVGMSGMVYLLSAIVLDLIFLGYAWKIYRAYSDELARRAFRFSIVYLSLLFAALLVDHYTRALIGF